MLIINFALNILAVGYFATQINNGTPEWLALIEWLFVLFAIYPF